MMIFRLVPTFSHQKTQHEYYVGSFKKINTSGHFPVDDFLNGGVSGSKPRRFLEDAQVRRRIDSLPRRQ